MLRQSRHIYAHPGEFDGQRHIVHQHFVLPLRTAANVKGFTNMLTLATREESPFGLLEIDSTGTVLYYRPEHYEEAHDGRREIVGCNFLADVATFENTKEFGYHLDAFRRSDESASSLYLQLRFADKSVAVKILLARMHARSETGRTKSILVHIRKA